ncbi:hydrocephalus-inducing protein homolog [Anguilla anguilla]|uniref:hydrocephalus-inducing protein homolog n=1 Tax=Anguilla anguilla TaxID=7936 RepID=UPI0015AFEB11|nr:hydrocephalus-inducing protein homolog [Anguilla anguilla]
MPTSKVLAASSTLQSLSPKMPEGFKSKVVAPRNPKLVKHEDRPFRLTPSAFAQEMSLSTEQRLASTHQMCPPRILELLDMSETTHQKSSSVDVDQPMFQPFPSEVVFQNCSPSETYQVPLVLRNNDKIPRLVKVVEEGSLYFKVVSPLDVCNKVAPGMASTFTILFTPQENKDYAHRLVCVTEREKFEVPVRAIGARAILDFPDHLHFPLNAVKCPAQKTLLVRNIGACEAKFQLRTQSPFSVEPSIGNLGVGECMQVTVEFLPKTTGDHAQDLLLRYHTGEDVYISLYGGATDVNVRLDRNSVIVERTFVSLANQRTVAIVNRSDVIIHYQWKSQATEEEEAQQKLRLCSELQKEEEDEMDQFLSECGADPTLRDRLSLLSRTFQERRRQLRDATPPFWDEHIALEPLEGDIWPNGTAEVNIIFKPSQARTYHLTVYCDITGRESRLPLRIKGEGIGPKLQFNFRLLDMGNIFIGSRHSYEVLLSNKGLIDAPFRLVPPGSTLGCCFSFSPSEGTVPPGACHAMEVTFCSHTLAVFTEEFLFSVEGNPQPVPLLFSGRVMGPTFHFSVPRLDFGDVAFGFPQTLTCCLNNTSLVPLTFGLRILGDGFGAPSVASVDQVSDLNRREWGTGGALADRPVEFSVAPSSGTLRPQGVLDVKVTLCSNTVRLYSLALVVDVRGVGEEVLALPVTARCVVPSVRLDPPALEFERCFLGHPYYRSVKLTNESDLPACYGLLSQEYEESPSVLYSSPHPRGILPPLSSVELPLVLQAKAVRHLQVTARIALFGSQEPPLDLLLSCTGEGPVVHVSAPEVDFGAVPVLTDVSRTLRLSNQSPVPARFQAQMVRSRSLWRVEPSEGEVPPEGEAELRLVAHLDDTLRFQDKLSLAVLDSRTHTVPVSATGKGTTIVSDRPFAPSLDLGAHFSSGPCQYHFRLTNRGRRSHQLYWMTEGFPQFRRRGNPASHGNGAREGRRRDPLLTPPAPPEEGPVFSLRPLRVELPPGRSVDMVLEGSSGTPRVVQERLVCQAIVGQQSGKDRIMTVDVRCQFVSPVLDLSPRELSFYVEKAPGSFLVPLFQPLVLRNVSSLPLSMDLGLVQPFGLCERQGDDAIVTSKSLVLPVGAKAELWVRFDPRFRRDSVTRVAEEVLEVRYRDHPQRDAVGLRGEVHFPNLRFSSERLDFGCVLNHTESQRQLTMTNCSPLPVTYRWAFLVDQDRYTIRFPRETAQEGRGQRTEGKGNVRWDPPEKKHADFNLDSSREVEAPTLHLEDEMEEGGEKNPENEIRGGRGSPMDTPPPRSSPVLTKEGMSGGDPQDPAHRTSPGQPPQSSEGNHEAQSPSAEDQPSVGVEQVFDILPIHGVLLPGESQQVSFTFYGHAHISGQALALCQVEGGPTYEIALQGESSLASYSLDTTEIDLGLQLFDRVAEAEVTLWNTGKVGLEFSALLGEPDLPPEDLLPGVPLVVPRTGHIQANAEQKLTVYYLPGVPEVFHATFDLQVSFFEVETVALRGEGIFPRVCLDLPRDLEEERYGSVLKEAREALERERQREEMLSRPQTGGVTLSVDDYVPTYDALLQMEVERLLVKENAVLLLEEAEEESRDTPGSGSRWRKRLSRFVLPEYALDFGCVIHGDVATHIVKATNTGPASVSFRADRRLLASSGFSTELDRVKNLPYCETETFEVKFDPRGANLDLGEVDAIMPIQVVGGPWVQVRLRAVVTAPSLTVSRETLHFGTIQCGQCQVITVQLSNQEPVPCEWSVAEEEAPKKKMDRHVPLHLRRKARQEPRPPPAAFQMLPSAGLLLPGDRVNVQVKFSPAEGQNQVICIEKEFDFFIIKGKTATAVALAKHYGAACLSVDSVVLEAVSTGGSRAGLQARELCARAAQEHAQKRAEETGEGVAAAVQGAGVLSVEALAKHTAEGSQGSEPKAGPASLSTRNKTSVAAGKKTEGSQPTSTSQPADSVALGAPVAQVHRRLSVSGSLAEDQELMTCLLPDDLLVDILSERLQLSDCHRGVVIDGLETPYCRSLADALQSVLKALSNRPLIYMVNLSHSYQALRATERAHREAAEREQRESMEREKLRLKEMDEEEYDALPEEEKERVDLQHLEELRQRRRREQERMQREQEERRQQEEQERLREEEEQRKRSKKGKKEQPKEEVSGKKSQLDRKQSSVSLRCESKLEPPLKDGAKPSTEGAREPEDAGRKGRSREGQAGSPLPSEDPEREQMTEADRQLLARFQQYEQSQDLLSHTLQYWDRAKARLFMAPPTEGPPPDPQDSAPERHAPSGKKGRKEREREREKEREKERVERERLKAELAPPSPASAPALLLGEALEGAETEAPPEGVPQILLPVSGRDHPSGAEILGSGKLPPLEEVLDGLGQGPKGPPVPPPVIYSVVPYPEQRAPPSAQEGSAHFTFLAPPVPEDPAEDRKEAELEPDILSSASLAKEDSVTPSRGRGKKGESGRESQRERRRTTGKRSTRSTESRSPTLSTVTPLSDTEQSSRTAESQQEQNQRLTSFRWIVPPKGEVTLKMGFHSSVPGRFEQTLNFELTGTRRRYQLHCRGDCAFPAVNQDYKVVFAQSKKALQSDDCLHKTYVVQSGVYEFGPLLCRKSRDRYKEGTYPENMEKFVMHNCSQLDAEVHFCFQHDTKATTFLLDPPAMTLKPNEKQELKVWAYPTAPGLFEDRVVCCVKDNPDPALLPLSCRGVRLELELDRKLVHFDKVLLGRRDTKSLILRNATPLPAAWRLVGLDKLGEEFSVAQDRGVVPPLSEFCLQVHFRSLKAVNLKRALGLEVSDVEGILGLVQTENLQILAEAYDVALDISFPKGADGGLDFGTIKVSDEAKLSVNLKNKGKYEIAFMFVLKSTDPSLPDLSSMFTITPQKGSLNPNERPTAVQILFRHGQEVCVREQQLLHCQVIEPNIAEGGETIACIPIKVSVQSLFAKYSILPSTDINFGPLVCGSRKARTFTIENRGHFELRFVISRMSKDQPLATQKKGVGTFKRSRSRESQSSKNSKVRRHDSLQKEMGASAQARVTMGVFTVSPGFGALGPGAQQVVTVDCVADQTGRWEEFLVLDVADRDPADHPDGAPYRLVAEVCVPEILCKDFSSIFEEHRICESSRLLHCEQYREAAGVYLQEENRFIFNNVLVGRPAKARFRITNTGKVPCDLNLTVKSALTKTQMRSGDVFEVTPARMSIPSHSHAFAVLTFCPQAIQSYSAVLEASLEGPPSVLQMAKCKGLAFDVAGEGNLPCVSVVRPALRGQQGAPLLQFPRVLAGRAHVLPLVLRNDGTVPAQVNIHLLDKMGVFTLRASPNTVCTSMASSVLHGDPGADRQVAHTASLVLVAGQQAEFEVEFRPASAQTFESTMDLLVADNQYEETVVRLVGEGYCDIITFDNIGSRPQQEQDSAEDLRSDLLNFGDCHVGSPYQQTFTLTNHGGSEALRFEWPADAAQVRFSPQVGHLHAGCAKEVTVTFCSDQPLALEARPVRCRVCRISFPRPVDQVPDWDDRQRTVKWVDAGKQGPAQAPAKRKVLETDPEPEHSVLDGSSRELELLISAVCDHAQFSCPTDSIRFRDTLLYQARAFQIQMCNEGKVRLDFSWQVLMERCGKSVSFDRGDEVQAGARGGSRTALRPATAGALESLSSLLRGDPSLPPFSVEPSGGSISPGSTQAFCVTFSPLEVAEFEGRLVCSIPNLKEEPGPTLAVSGRSLLPYCHFQLEDSDYLSSGRRDPETRAPRGAPPKGTLDPNTRVIEITSVGVGTPVSRVFGVLNPTRKPYSFSWRCEDGCSSPFRCPAPKGSIQPGKKVEVCFEFLARELGTVESFWTFLIAEQGISVPFLLVGTAREPAVYLDRAHLHLGSLLVGREVCETVYVVNREDVPFHFSIRENSRHSEAFRDSLLLEPLKGTVPPRDRVPVSVSFGPAREGSATFNLVCDVTGKVQPLSLNVKAEGYSMSACVRCEGPAGGVTELRPGAAHQVDFRQVELSDKSSCHFLVSNPGKYSLDVQYELWGPSELQRHLLVEREMDSVAVGQEVCCTVTFCPQQKCVLKNTGLSIRIKNGPMFSCSLSGAAVPPGLDFSFLKHNFGMKFIYQAGMVPASHTLVIANKGERGVSLDCLFSNTAFLEVGFQPEVLPPGGAVEVPFAFYPREAARYQEKVVFQINDCARQAVEVLGQGVEMQIAVEDPRHKTVNLGVIQVGQKTKRVIPLVNSSPMPLTFTLTSSPSLEALLDSKVLSVSPADEVTLRGSGGRCLVEVQFCPRQRMPPFREELQLECLGTVRPLLVLKGCCQGMEISLDQDYVPFGAVAQRCQATRRIVMSNTGDVGARFKWDVKKFSPHFSISPAEGYICPGMEVPFDVTFAPMELSQDVRCDNLPCTLERGAPLKLTLAGSCVTSPITKEVVAFACAVRSQHTQALSLCNRSGQRWSLSPAIEGEDWSGPSAVVMEPHQQSHAYEITYRPLVMTTEGKKHQGSVFFAFPDGTGVLYTLLGTAEPPKPAGTISHEMPCKTPYTELLPVQNWLNKPQRFRVVVDMLKPERADPTVTLKGLDYLDVPALSKRDYKLSFFSYKEGLFSAKVTFRNEATQEYLFYHVTFRATAAGVVRAVEMATAVRQTAAASLTVENPLPTAVCFTTECRCADISLPPQLPIPPLSAGTLMFEYQPLREGESTARLTLHCAELGHFHYDLLLRATPPPPERPLLFRAPLGGAHAVSAKFTNHARAKTEYTCKTDSPDFTTERTVTAPAGLQGGTEVSVEVCFEPCQLGESRALLTLSSSTGGEYQIPLQGSCYPPKPQGPFSVRAGSSVSIPFKNVFPQPTAFSFQVDNPAFVVRGADVIRPKKTHSVLVSFEGPTVGSPSGPRGPCSGRLTISSPRSEGHGQGISWVYYLKGLCPESPQRDKS